MMKNETLEGIQKTVVVSVSGASSSGKTTLCRLLKDIFPNILVIHQDDFFKPEKEIPYKDGLIDWDCVEALSLPDMIDTLNHVRQNGSFPPHLKPEEHDEVISPTLVSETLILALKKKVDQWLAPGQPGHILHSRKICFFEGFLLYCQPYSELWPYLDLKLFLRSSYSTVKSRREMRNGYITTDNYYVDPPNYVDRIVWPNYCRNHEWMFENGDVEGKLLHLPDPHCKIISPDGIDIDIDKTLVWMVDLLMKELPDLLKD